VLGDHSERDLIEIAPRRDPTSGRVGTLVEGAAELCAECIEVDTGSECSRVDVPGRPELLCARDRHTAPERELNPLDPYEQGDAERAVELVQTVDVAVGERETEGSKCSTELRRPPWGEVRGEQGHAGAFEIVDSFDLGRAGSNYSAGNSMSG